MNDRDVEPELPEELSLEQAYATVRSWFRSDLLEGSKGAGPYGEKLENYIADLPDPDVATEDEMVELLHEVGTNSLERAYWQRDEDGYHLGAYYKRFSDRVREWQARRSNARSDGE